MEFLGDDKPINQMQPLVSVCVPAFYHAAFIEKCLLSILSQKTLFDFEILVGEDDSKDGTREICISLAEKHPDKIRLFLRKEADKMLRNGKKVGRGNHLGLYQSARGKYVCICDGDDYWLSDLKLQHQFDLMESNPAAALCLGKTHVEGDQPPVPAKWPGEVRVLSAKDLALTYYLGHVSSWMLRNHMVDFVKNEAALQCPGLDLVLFSFYKHRGSVIQSPELLSFYRFNPNGSLRRMTSQQVKKKVFVVSWYLYRYIHHDPILYARSLLYFTKRLLLNLVFSKIESK